MRDGAFGGDPPRRGRGPAKSGTMGWLTLHKSLHP